MPNDAAYIMRVLRSMNKTMNDNLLKIWLERMRAFLSSEHVIQPFEFLYILANCQSREDYLKRVMCKDRKSVEDSYHKMSGTYRLEEANNFRAPDILIQRVLKSECPEKVVIEGEIDELENFQNRY